MRIVGIAILMVLAGCVTAPPTAGAEGDAAPGTPPVGTSATVPSNAVHAELQRLERSKWSAASAADRAAFLALFADDFVSVEYGSDVQGGVHRRTRADVFSGPPAAASHYELSDWHFIQADDDVVVVSYRVTGTSFPWQAYATSVWSHRGDEWVTVFYQTSTATKAR
jgi:hypothetical protein